VADPAAQEEVAALEIEGIGRRVGFEEFADLGL